MTNLLNLKFYATPTYVECEYMVGPDIAYNGRVYFWRRAKSHNMFHMNLLGSTDPHKY